MDTPFMTLDEYLELEEKGPIRHEYVNGAIYAMNGVSVAHLRIARELVMALGGHLRGGPAVVLRPGGEGWSCARSAFQWRWRRFMQARCSAPSAASSGEVCGEIW
jgi:Putative restriction endonuclease